MFLRVLFVSLLLGISLFIQIKNTQIYFGYIQTSHFLLIAFIYLLTFLYVVALKYSKDPSWLAYVQLLMDTVVVTAIIFATGGTGSVFSFLYILTIINGSILLYRQGGMVIASSSSILYGLLILMDFHDLIHPMGSLQAHDLKHGSLNTLYLISVNILAFYVVAYLSSYLSEQARWSRNELKAKQTDIDKLEALNESIINGIGWGLVVLDGQHRIILCNPASAEIFGFRPEAALGKTIEEVLPFLKAYLENETSSISQSARRPSPFIDLPYVEPEGNTLALRLSVSSLGLPVGNQRGWILFVQDMTQVKKIEEEMKKVEGLAMIGELAAGIAHEVRNPMASISGSIQMLRESLPDNDVNGRLMDIILREINRLNHLVNEFLLFARPKKPNLKTFDLNQLILETRELFQNSRHVNGRIGIAAKLCQPVLVQSDPDHLKQVLWNLLLNACEAMPDGGLVEITTELMADSNSLGSPKDQVKIAVRDNGKGFSEKALSGLFTPFFTTKEEGSGLGLAIVRRIVEGLDGEVCGDNDPAGGAVVSITLPISPSDSAPLLQSQGIAVAS
jgi:two-component system sensor histidine kinase PilS (NtrC family)